MINLKELIYYKENFLSEEECQLIIDAYENNPEDSIKEHCFHAFTGLDTKSTFDLKIPILGSSAFDLIHKSVETMVLEYHDYLDTFEGFHVMRKISMLHPHMYRLMKYKKGSWIHPHVDHGHIETQDGKRSTTYGSCTINLNEDYTGGLFSFWGGKHKIKMKKGDAMIWPADYFWVHEVEPIESGVRYSVNCFLNDAPVSLPASLRYNVDINENSSKQLIPGPPIKYKY